MVKNDKLNNKDLMYHLQKIKKLLKVISNNNNFKNNPEHNLKIIVYGVESFIHQFLKIENLENLLADEQEIKEYITEAISLIYFYFLENNFIDKQKLLESSFLQTKINKAKEKIHKQAEKINLQEEELLQLKEKTKKIEANCKKSKKLEEEFILLKEDKLKIENKYIRSTSILKKLRAKQKTLKIENDEFKKIIKILKQEEKEKAIKREVNHKNIQNEKTKSKVKEDKLKIDPNRKTEKIIENTNNENKRNKN
ncbi:MAG: hypothetical protein HPPSJP_2650 [Candidatus Hepatoplasma scabrum]|nr:MAG: hypothetical protein HPPSJP_2650 [Candidatus Hepatoplasma sp.]